MTTIKETRRKILADPEWWKLYFYDFVDEFRRERDPEIIAEPFDSGDEKIDALLASTIEKLCREIRMPIPEWVKKIPACQEPFFVSEIENLKAAAIVQSPLAFKMRNVFVSETFLVRF